MKYACFTSVVLSLIFSSSVSADVTYYAPGAEAWLAQAKPRSVPSPQQNVQINGVNAEGKKQGTIVDQNGNLKVVDSESAKPLPAPPPPEASQMAPGQPIPNQAERPMPPQAKELQPQGQSFPQQPGSPEGAPGQASPAVNNGSQPMPALPGSVPNGAQSGMPSPLSQPLPPEQMAAPKK